MWDLIVSVPDHCLPFYLKPKVTTDFITKHFYSCFDLIKINLISFQDLPKQNSGKMIYASYSTTELSAIQ